MEGIAEDDNDIISLQSEDLDSVTGNSVSVLSVENNHNNENQEAKINVEEKWQIRTCGGKECFGKATCETFIDKACPNCASFIKFNYYLVHQLARAVYENKYHVKSRLYGWWKPFVLSLKANPLFQDCNDKLIYKYYDIGLRDFCKRQKLPVFPSPHRFPA
jgi:hypothetical protein